VHWLILLILLPFGLLMWASLKALRISGHQMNEDSKHLVSGRRKLYWSVVVGFVLCIAVGAIVGTVIGDPHDSVTASWGGAATGGAIGFVLLIVGLVVIGPVRRGPENVPYSEESKLLPTFRRRSSSGSGQ
jgi:hypothetical protein